MRLADGTIAKVGMEVTRVDGTPDGIWPYYLVLGRITGIYPGLGICYVDFVSVGGEDGRDYKHAKKEATNCPWPCDAKYLIPAASQVRVEFNEQDFLSLLT